MRAWAFLLALAMCPAARADDHALPDADVLFQQGRHAADAGNYEVACAKFEASRRIEPAPGTVLNLADCEEARGELTRAWREFIQLADTLPDGDPRKVVALVRARNLERTMPKLRVRLTKTSEGARVRRDDVELGEASLGLPLPVDPGRHAILVTEPGHRDQTYSVEVERGEEKDVEIGHGPATHDARKALGLGLLSFGLTSLTVGSVTGVVALANLQQSNAECAGNVCATQDGVTHYENARAFGLATDVAFGLGAAFTIAGIVLLAVHGGH